MLFKKPKIALTFILLFTSVPMETVMAEDSTLADRDRIYERIRENGL